MILILLRRIILLFPFKYINAHACKDHQYTEHLSHTYYSPYQAKLYIRLPVKLNNEANQSITDYIQGKKKAVKRAFISDAPEDYEKDYSLKKGLIKLRRMAELV